MRDIEGSVWKEDVGGCRGVEVRNKERKEKKKKKYGLKERKEKRCTFENNFQSLTHLSIPEKTVQ